MLRIILAAVAASFIVTQPAFTSDRVEVCTKKQAQDQPVASETLRAASLPYFEHETYRVTVPTAPKKNAVPKISGTSYSKYESRILQEADEVPNFAGKYRLIEWGCGSNCTTGVIIDVFTGDVFPIPASGWGLAFCTGSKLLIANMISPTMKPTPMNVAVEFFTWTGTKFKLVHGPIPVDEFVERVQALDTLVGVETDTEERTGELMQYTMPLTSVSGKSFEAYHDSCAKRTNPLLMRYFHGDPSEMAYVNDLMEEQGFDAREKITFLVDELGFPRDCVLEMYRHTHDSSVEVDVGILSETDVVWLNDIVWEWSDLTTFGEPDAYYAAETQGLVFLFE